MNVSAPDLGPRAPRGDGPGAGARNGNRKDGQAPKGQERGVSGQSKGLQDQGPQDQGPQGKSSGKPGKPRKEQRQRRRTARTADQGVSLIEEIAVAQRALDRERLDEYARMVAAATGGDTPAEIAFRSLRAELATALHQSEFTVERELDIAHTIATRYPAVGEVLGTGLIGLPHVQVICDAGIIIGSGENAIVKHALYEAAVLEYAVEETPGRLRPIAKRLAEQFAEVSLEERHTVARKRRRIEVLDREDGMAELYAFLPAEVAYAAKDRLYRIAKQAWLIETAEAEQAAQAAAAGAAGASAGERAGDGDSSRSSSSNQSSAGGSAGVAGETGSTKTNSSTGSSTDSVLRPRTLDEVRADTFAELLLTGNPYTDLDLGDGSKANAADLGFLAHLQILVPVEALSTGSGLPRPVCELAGYGPISALVAQDMLEASHNTYRVDVDDAGTVLQVDRYKPTKAMKELLRARDRHCRFPGCMRLPMSCDVDHTVAWEDGGKTCTDNLAHLCRAHHVLKHHSAWNPVFDVTGTLTWLSPTGRIHRDRPAGRRPRSSAPGGGRGIGGFGWWPQTARGPDCPPAPAPAPAPAPGAAQVPGSGSAQVPGSGSGSAQVPAGAVPVPADTGIPAAAAPAPVPQVRAGKRVGPGQASRVGQTKSLRGGIPEVRTGTTVRFGGNDSSDGSSRAVSSAAGPATSASGKAPPADVNSSRLDRASKIKVSGESGRSGKDGKSRKSGMPGLPGKPGMPGLPGKSSLDKLRSTGLNTNAGADARSNVNANSGPYFNVEVTINAAPAGYSVRDRLTPLERHALTCGCDIPAYHDADYMAELDERDRRHGINSSEQPF